MTHPQLKSIKKPSAPARTAILSAAEIAAKTGIGLMSVYRLMDLGTLPTFRIGSRRYVTSEAFEAWWRENGRVQAPPARAPAPAPYHRVSPNLKLRSSESVLMSVPEFATMSGLGYSYVRKLIDRGEITFLRTIGDRKWVIRKAAIAWLEGETS